MLPRLAGRFGGRAAQRHYGAGFRLVRPLDPHADAGAQKG